MNILILSAGTRNLIVRYFKKELDGGGSVIATDCSPYAPALYDADKAFLVPRITEDGYIAKILGICVTEKIDGVFSLIDPELSLIAKHREAFEERGTKVIVSDGELCDLTLDKAAFIESLEHDGIRCVNTYTDLSSVKDAISADILHYPLYIKPRRGSASIGINRVDTKEMLYALFRTMQAEGAEPVVQEFMDAEEYGADAYVDLVSGKCAAVFLKKKIKMRAGETDKAISVKDEKAVALIREIAENKGFRGMIDIDLFKKGEEWIVSEVNPRFGGGYPHAYAAGVNFPRMVLNNLEGRENKPGTADYKEGIVMMKYSDIVVREEKELIP